MYESNNHIFFFGKASKRSNEEVGTASTTQTKTELGYEDNIINLSLGIIIVLIAAIWVVWVVSLGGRA